MSDLLQGVLGHVINPVRQLYERIPATEAAADADTRYDHFIKRVWPRIKESGASGQTCRLTGSFLLWLFPCNLLLLTLATMLVIFCFV